MLMDFFLNLNWVDILMVIILGWVVYMGVKSGFVAEFFKILGVIFAIFLSFHYYSGIASVVASKVTLFQLTTINVFFFLLLWALVTFVFKLFRDGLMLLFSVEAQPQVDKWGGIILSIVRGVLVCSLVFTAILLTQHSYWIKLAQHSFARRIVANIAPAIYTSTYNNFISKFFSSEVVNQDALNISKILDSKDKPGH